MVMNNIIEERFDDVEMFRSCEQCGLCSSACPKTGDGDFNIRRIIRHIELGLIGEIAGTALQWDCTTCGRCEDACPNGIAILDIIRPLRSMTPRDLLPDSVPPCSSACPAGIDIPGYLRFIARGRPEDACATILEKVPFPGILGRVCTRPCETECRRSEVNDPVSICALKRYASDKASDAFERVRKMNESTGKRVAIVGSGPAGLTAAFYLRKKGHDITVFEGRSRPGGMMRYGIPRYRLPGDVLDAETDNVLGLGIQLEVNRALGKDFDLDSLKEEGFDAVFIATGLQLGRKIDLEGVQSEGVFWGIDLLGEISDGKEIEIKDRVLVVGGGNVAVDVALTALRLGAKDVTMACLENREEMPANPWEIEMALEEGIRFLCSRGPKRILEDAGKVTGMELIQCTSVFDENGDFSPAFSNRTEMVETDQIVLAIGQAADLSFVNDKEQLRIEQGLIVIDEESHETDIHGVFAGGDAVQGPGSVIGAIAAGRRAASSIDRFLGGDGDIEESIIEREAPDHYAGKKEKGFADLPRAETPEVPVSKRYDGFTEVEIRLDDVKAIGEAKRCLQCDLELRMAGVC